MIEESSRSDNRIWRDVDPHIPGSRCYNQLRHLPHIGEQVLATVEIEPLPVQKETVAAKPTMCREPIEFCYPAPMACYPPRRLRRCR